MALDDIDPTRVPLPNGTKVTTRVDRTVDNRTVPQGAVGQVVASYTEDGVAQVDVKLASGETIRFTRADLVPTKLGQLRYAVRREQAWQALRPTVILETIVGSRAWGLSDETSDVDRRGVFVLPFPWTTALVEPPSDLVSADGSDTYWEIEKTIRQALRADPNTLETLFLPNAAPSDPMGEWLVAARHAVVSRAIYGSFGRYALSQLKRLEQSQRLASHRAALVRWIAAQATPTLDTAAAHLSAAARVEGPNERDRLARAKSYIKQLYGSLYDKGLLRERDFPSFVAFAQRADLEDEPLPRHLRPKNAYNLIRLIATATDWLKNGEPRFEAEGALRDQLLAIKRGEVPLDEVLTAAEAMMPALDDARRRTPLPDEPDLVAADGLLRRIRHEAARRFLERAPGIFGVDAPSLDPPTKEDP